MKNLLKVVTVLLLIFIFNSCRREKPTLPVLTTTAPSAVSYSSAISGGEILNDGGAPLIIKGVCWNKIGNPAVEDSITNDKGITNPFISNIFNLESNTLYYLRAYATNIAGTAYGNQVSFTTMHTDVPILTTTAVTSVTQTSAVSGGNITDEKGGPVTARGVCWSTAHYPTITDGKTTDGAGPGSFKSDLTGLQQGMIYYARAYATNKDGTAYGNEIMFQTQITVMPIIFNPDLTYGTVTDIDGNIYKTIAIGNLIWMAENLRTTRYNNGDSIGTTYPPAKDMGSEAEPKYQWAYNGIEDYVAMYGRLYTWYVMTDTRKACPAGWHLPSFDEWVNLGINFGQWNSSSPGPGMPTYTSCTVAGGKMKENSTSHWSNPNAGASNGSGFTALPGGCRNVLHNNTFENMGSAGQWWSSTPWSSKMANIFYTSTNTDALGRYDQNYMMDGFSVRCVNDNPLPVTSATVTSVTTTSAVVGGTVSSDLTGANERGVYWGSTNNAEITGTKMQIGSGTGTFSATLTGLSPNTTYYLKTYVNSSTGISYGSEISFTTAKEPPVTTRSVSSITSTSAISGGNVTVYDGTIITARGVCWSTMADPTINDTRTTDGSGSGNFTSTLTGLQQGLTYHIRAYATTNDTTIYGNEVVFLLLSPIIFNPDITYGTISDIDGNEYKTVIIGNQTWMAENLKTTRFNNGDLIGTTNPATLDIGYHVEINPECQWAYSGDESYVPVYGRLYTWFAISDSRNVCPAGWHVPADSEWDTLVLAVDPDAALSVGKESVLAAGKLSESGTGHWNLQTPVSTNASGFSALPGGDRQEVGEFELLGQVSLFWSSKAAGSDEAWSRAVLTGWSDVGVFKTTSPTKFGLSVRCVRDN